MVINTNPLDLVMEVTSIILPFSYEKEERERGEIQQNFIIGHSGFIKEFNDRGSPSIDSA